MLDFTQKSGCRRSAKRRSSKRIARRTHKPAENLTRSRSDTHVREEGEEGSDEGSDIGKSGFGCSSEDLEGKRERNRSALSRDLLPREIRVEARLGKISVERDPIDGSRRSVKISCGSRPSGRDQTRVDDRRKGLDAGLLNSDNASKGCAEQNWE